MSKNQLAAAKKTFQNSGTGLKGKEEKKFLIKENEKIRSPRLTLLIAVS
jgi:hypothetical protein